MFYFSQKSKVKNQKAVIISKYNHIWFILTPLCPETGKNFLREEKGVLRMKYRPYAGKGSHEHQHVMKPAKS